MSEKNLYPVVATKTINGTIAPNTIFAPETVAELKELKELDAVKDCTEADKALWASTNPEYAALREKQAAAAKAKAKPAAAAAAPAAADIG